MSADKNRAKVRRHHLVEIAFERSQSDRIGIMLNHEGGMASSNKDLQKAISLGYLKIWRGFRDGTTTYGKKSELRPGNTPRTYAVITPAGKAYLNKGK